LTATKPSDAHGDKELQDLLIKISDFEYILLMASLDLHINHLLKEAFWLFTKNEITLITEPPSIILGPLEDKHIMDE